MQFWAQHQPHAHQTRQLSVQKVTIRCILGCNGIIGPYWFEDADGHPSTIYTIALYCTHEKKFIPALNESKE